MTEMNWKRGCQTFIPITSTRVASNVQFNEILLVILLDILFSFEISNNSSSNLWPRPLPGCQTVYRGCRTLSTVITRRADVTETRRMAKDAVQ